MSGDLVLRPVMLPELGLGGPLPVYLASLKAGRSRYTTLQSLRLVAQALCGPGVSPGQVPWPSVRYGHATLAKAWLESKGYSGNTINKAMAALRGVLKAAWSLELMTTDAYYRTVRVKGVKANPLPAGRVLGPGEVRRVLDACPATRAGIRDAAAMAIMVGCGLRRAEVVGLGWKDVGRDSLLSVHQGKGGKARRVPIPAGTREAVSDLHRVMGSPGSGWMFVRLTTTHGHIWPGAPALLPPRMYDVCRRAAKRAGVQHFSPHDLRRTCVTRYLDAGVGLLLVQAMAGHASVDTTKRYDRRGETALLEASRVIEVPYSPADDEVIQGIAGEDGEPDI